MPIALNQGTHFKKFTINMTTPALPVTSLNGNVFQEYVRGNQECEIRAVTGGPDGSRTEMVFVGQMKEVRVDLPPEQKRPEREALDTLLSQSPLSSIVKPGKQEDKEKHKQMPQVGDEFYTTILSASGGQTLGYERYTVDPAKVRQTPFAGVVKVESLTPQQFALQQRLEEQERLVRETMHRQKAPVYTHTYTPSPEQSMRGQSFELLAVDEAAEILPSLFGWRKETRATREERPSSSSILAGSALPHRQRQKGEGGATREKSILRG